MPVIAGGVEASLRRLAHYDYWSDTVRRSILLDSKADLVVYGMGEKNIVEIAKRFEAGKSVKDMRDLRGVAYALGASESALLQSGEMALPGGDQYPAAITIPSYEAVRDDKMKFVEATRHIHINTNPFNAAPLIQYHDRQAIVCNPPVAPAVPGRDGSHLRPAVHAPAAPQLHRPRTRLRDDQGFGYDHARLLRRLHLLLDHRPPGPHHPVALAEIRS